MSWTSYDTATAYVVAQVQAVYPTAHVYSDNSVAIVDWFNGAGTHQGSYYVSYEGYTPEEREDGTGPLAMSFNVYFHGRTMAESIMHALRTQFIANKTFTLNDRTQTARVTGGRYLLLDRGFDTYQLEIQII